MNRPTFPALLALFLATSANIALADWTDAACEIYPKGEDKASAFVPCVFSQRQGAVTITLEDGSVYDLRPVGDDPGNYEDQDGKAAYRQSGLGDQGQIYRLANESIYVYWDTSALNPLGDDDNGSAPFTTADYDATTRLRCKAAGDAEYGSCPAGIARMDDNQASITVLSPLGEQFTINFMTDDVNATNRELKASLDGDTWTLNFANGETWEVPLAAIEGG